MKKICSSRHCTGCGACMNACPKNCIQLEYDNDGFLQPRINAEQCINCQRCEKTCPVRHAVEKHTPVRSIVACSKDNEILLSSSSGGIFSELAKSIFEVGGIVFGVAFEDDFLSVYHCMAENSDELSKMQGSKYIQSNVRNAYCAAKKYLIEGKQVLFSGTPCQIAGLKSFLGKEYPNLITVDFICHGVASTKAYHEYLKSLRMGKQICDLQFRHKNATADQYMNHLLKIRYSDGCCVEEKWLSSQLGYAFANNLLNRMSCSSCKYATVSRVSDITIADYISNIDDEMLNKSNSCKSLVLINTKTGDDAFTKISDHLLCAEISLAKAVSVSKHLSSPAIQHRNRRLVFKYLGKWSWEKVAAKYFTVYRPVRTFKSIINKFSIWPRN